LQELEENVDESFNNAYSHRRDVKPSNEPQRSPPSTDDSVNT